MPNSFFRFKQFTIQQDACAMKVCTDSCLFGAWAAYHLGKLYPGNKNILDIGTGTSLLSLMLAQKLSSVNIDAVEIETVCFRQAQLNVSQSAWYNRITVYEGDINYFLTQKKYDIIISNPPFYESDVRSAKPEKNMAHHDVTLTLDGLSCFVKTYLSETGCFAILLPYQRMVAFENMALANGLHAYIKTLVKQTPQHPFFRAMLLFTRDEKFLIENEITITNEHSQYSSAFISLLKDYYLYL